tara:strand:+ start:40084 stop:41307 length:1224 start_codon:yes stop_codon:yes gene_type:complete
MNQLLPLYDVHPISIKLLKKGHPWIIKDKFTDKFQPRERFIVAKERRRPFSLLIHDPKHSNIKARVWSSSGDFGKLIKNFKKDLQQRIFKAIKKRQDLKIIEKRDNIFLIFGEADELPGIKATLLGDQVLIQFYSYFWENYEELVINNIIKTTNQVLNKDITKADVWIQYRADSSAQKKAPKSLDPNCSYKNIQVKEFGVLYNVQLGKLYDYGLYTDMASVRSHLEGIFKDSDSVLNLFSYTGAFSLYSLALGSKDVVSVDLSESYIQDLEENILLNEFDKDSHQSIIDSVENAMNHLNKENRVFDLIISDPPSSSSDKNKRSNALKDYEKLLPKMVKSLKPGGKIIAFLNTHKINRNKFRQKLEQIITENNFPLKITKTLKLAEDCPELRGFPEGSYLKGFILSHD